ncbi:hypothetical protein EV193_108126 [Herbihabitans rhizosphaerae]|uniref:Uncharacterized protein n=1 Tax=Herbihabitans rhizosphaerae TaxID=1872711 RepID=A0A4Q7KIL9_9PSEU|nr:hypothetical protein [Herbihabitans rhizosphaerae]RZS34778.1 hypothetical protein EV193_108126 [Herbihabitans rhizosphaerae]
MARTSAPDLTSAADELYALPKEEFIARRGELVKQARDAGEPEVAARIGKLAKPTTAAWLANQLARQEPRAVADFVDLGARLREAHGRLDGGTVRTLSAQRTEQVRELLALVREIADGTLTDTVLRDIESMLTTALADPAAARALSAGRMTSAKNLGAPDWPLSLVAAPEPREEREPAPEKPDPKQARRIERARDELKAARAEVKEAEAARSESERTLEEIEDAATTAADRVRELERELETAQRDARTARRDNKGAREAVREAGRRSDRAWRAVQQAEQALSELE